MDEGKVKAVMNWPEPQTIKELQRFLGFANFYRRFVRNFSSVAAPLTSLFKGSSKKLRWNEAATSAFRKLKDMFTSAPVLRHPDPALPFVVEVDASETGAGGVLSQRQDPARKMARQMHSPGSRNLRPPRTLRDQSYHLSTSSLPSGGISWGRYNRPCQVTRFPRGAPGIKHMCPQRSELSSFSGCIHAPVLGTQGFTTILVAVDRFSKACRLIPLKKLPSALETAESLFHHVFRTFGLPEEIVSDRGVQFTSKVWAAFFKMLNVQVNLSSGYHPQSNGQTERLNQEIGRFLRAYCFQQPGEWSRFLPWAEYAQNSHKSTSTRISPFQCMLGFQPALFPWSGEPSEILAVDNWLRRSRTVWDATRTEIQRAVQRQKKYADQRRRPAPRFQPGQDVWLSTRNIRLRLPSKKLSPRFIGPFKIIKQINTVSYRLQLPSHYMINPTFHVSLLKPAVRTEGRQSGPEVQPAPPPPLLDDGVTYTVRALLNSRRRQSGLQYLVDWEGYGPEERAWRPAADIHPDLITDFHQAHPECPGPRPRGRPPRRGRTSASGAACRRGGSVTGRRSPSPEY
uniref:Integrase catalytic domain-containing protein n=1 Tax=Gasterosteus aculeatus aculeatus TaxID=481459 RepID=A0AAQ4PEW7_GASAC